MIILHNHKGAGSFIIAFLLLVGCPLSAYAAQIDENSELSFFGTYTPTGSVDLETATGLSFPNPVIIAAGVNDFAFSVGGNASFMSFDFIAVTPSIIFTFAGGGVFTASTISVGLQTATSLELTLTGNWSLTGFDDTPGQLILTADSLGDLFTFSGSGIITTGS